MLYAHYPNDLLQAEEYCYDEFGYVGPKEDDEVDD